MTHEIHEKLAQGSAAHSRRWRILVCSVWPS